MILKIDENSQLNLNKIFSKQIFKENHELICLSRKIDGITWKLSQVFISIFKIDADYFGIRRNEANPFPQDVLCYNQ